MSELQSSQPDPGPDKPKGPEFQAYTPPTYEELFPDAAATFAKHIVEARTPGDPFDRRKSLHARYIAVQIAAPLTLAAELGVNGGTPTPLALGVGAAGASVAVWRNVRSDRKVLSKEAERHEDAAEKVGQSYEIYRNARIGNTCENADLELVWYAPSEMLANHRGAVEGLRQMALLAKEHGIKRMHIDGEQCHHIHRWLGRTGGTKYRLMHAYMQDKKGVYLQPDNGAEELKLVLGTPDSWLRFIDEAPPATIVLPEENKPNLLKVIDTLRRLKPEHPIIPIADLYGKATDEDSKRYFRQKIDNTMLQRLFRQEMYPERGREFKIREQPFMPRDIIDTELGYISEKADAIVWRTHRNGLKSQDIFNFFDLTQEEYHRLLTGSPEDNPDLNVDTLVKALELAIIRTAHGQPPEAIDPHSEQSEALPIEPLSVRPLQHRLKEKSIFDINGGLKRHRWRQVIGSAAALLAVGCGIYATHQTVDAKEASAVARAQAQLANRHGIDPDFVTAEDAKNHLDKHSWKWSAWHTVARTEQAINKSWDDIVPDWGVGLGGGNEPAGAASSATESGVGNTSLPDIPDFTIVAHNGAKADGFWAASTASRLLIERPSDIIGRGLTLTWLQDTQITSNDSTLPKTPPTEYRGKPWLKVHRDLVGADSFELADELNPKELNTLINIPVLEGTSPIAININGKQANMVVKSDGTYGVSLPSNQKPTGKLTYWLAKTPEPLQLLNSGAIELVTKNDQGEIESDYDNLNQPEIGPKSANRQLKLSKTFYPGYSDKPVVNITKTRKALERIGQKQSETISNTWRYTHTPFKKDQEDGWESLDDWVAAAKKGKKANCNVANTVAGLYDITSAQVMGYTNHPGSGAGVLSAKEAHQKRTTGDATPKIQAAPVPPEKPSNPPVTPLQIAALGVGALLIAERRRLQRIPMAVAEHLDDKAAQRREKALTAVPVEDIATTYAVIQRQLYAPQITSKSLQSDTARLGNASKQQLLDMFTQQQYLRPEHVGALTVRANESSTADNPDLATTLHRSATILHQVQQVVRDRDGEDGIAVSGLASLYGAMSKPAAIIQKAFTKRR